MGARVVGKYLVARVLGASGGPVVGVLGQVVVPLERSSRVLSAVPVVCGDHLVLEVVVFTGLDVAGLDRDGRSRGHGSERQNGSLGEDVGNHFESDV